MSNIARVWSPNQQAIFQFVESGTGNAVMKAVAGSGKTTTIVEALSRVRGSSIFLAFNKSIAEELKKRGVNARTFHSMTYSAVLQAKGARTVEVNKLRILVDEWLGDEECRLYGAFICRMVGLGRQAGIGCLTPDVPEAWAELAEHHDIEPERDDADLGTALRYCSELLRRSNASALVDFDDLLYCAVKDGVTLPKFDFVFVDEAQDTNAIQRALLRKLLRKGSRLVAVGDPAQAIYGFRGADSESLNLIAAEFDCRWLPLTVSYRCPGAVVAFVQQWVSHIEAAPGAPEGTLAGHGQAWTHKLFAANDLVVCRTTRPLVALAFQLIKARIPARILGREIGQGLTRLIEKMRARGIDNLAEKLQAHTEIEVQKAIGKGNEAKADAAQDRADTILCMIDSLKGDERTIPGLLAAIENLFADKANAMTLSTIHKAKGLESRRVFWLNSSLCPAKWARQDWQKQQEVNLCYVAATRAMSELHLIEEKKDERQ